MNEMSPTTPTVARRPAHELHALERGDITVRGVEEVLSFDETNVRLVTTGGILNLEGRDLRIHTLDTRDGIVHVTGTLDGVLYEPEESRLGDGRVPRKGLFGRRG